MKHVSIAKKQLMIPTYPWDKPDIEPPLLREFTPRGQPIYPYTTLETLSDKKIQKRYKAVVLENEYLRLTFLPQLNGRLYSAFDKVNQTELFYANRALKPALFGLRGAWCATGVEYNFPNSHSTTTLTPVDWFVKEHPDGSASFVCGDVEQVSRMTWSVEVTLRPNYGAIEMVSRLYNGGDFPGRFYYWVNAAVPVHEQTQFIYPPTTTRLYTHPPMDASRIAYVDYPVHRGCDISYFGNIRQHFPIFAESMQEDFFGLYHHHINRGLVHIADHALVSGRKIWTFGCARDGRIWIDRLTDEDGDYAEIQTGPFPLQSDYRFLAPGATHTQKELWYPVAGIGGFNAASDDMAANVKVGKGRVTVHLCANRNMPGLLLRCAASNANLLEQHIRLSALKAGKFEFILPESAEHGGITIECYDKCGKKVLSYITVIRQTMSTPCRTLPHTQGSYLKGFFREQLGYPLQAAKLYAEVEDTNTQARTALSRLLASSGQFEAARTTVKTVLASDRENADALYIHALCLIHAGDFSNAEKNLSVLMHVQRERALFLLAKVSVLKKDYHEAQVRIAQYVSCHGSHSHLTALDAFCLRKRGCAQQAKKMREQTAAQFPFESLLRGEMILARENGPLPRPSDQQAIEIICAYMNLHETEDALKLINSQIGRRRNNILPLLYYYKRCLENMRGKISAAKSSLSRERAGSAVWDFPFRLESETVLTEAIQYNSNDSPARYQLGNLLAFLGRWEEAAEQWQRVKGKNAPLARRNLGLYWWKIKHAPHKAAREYTKAVDASVCGAKTLWEYDHLLEDMSRTKKRLSVLRNKAHLVSSDSRLLLRLASALKATGRHTEALTILQTRHFDLCEGKMLPRLIFEDICRSLGNKKLRAKDYEQALEFFRMPLKYPENLGAGKPAGNMEAKWWFLSGKVLRKMNKPQEAQTCFQRGAEEDDILGIEFFPLKKLVWEYPEDLIDVYVWENRIYRAQCCRALGKTGRADKILKETRDFVSRKTNEVRANEPELQQLQRMLVVAK